MADLCIYYAGWLGQDNVMILPVLLKKGVHGKIMGKMRWLKRGIYGLAWSFILFAGIGIVAGGFEEMESVWWKEMVRSVTGAVFQTTAPASAYVMEEEHPETLAEYLVRAVREAAPVWEYAGQKNAGAGLSEPIIIAEEHTENTDIIQNKGNESRETEEKESETTGQTAWTEEEKEVQAETDQTEQSEETAENSQNMTEVSALPEDIFSPSVIGTEYPLAKLCDYDFLVRNFYAVSEITTITSSELNAGELLSKELTLEQNKENPQILIYHTHSQEAFTDSRPDMQEDTIVGVGSYLTEILTEQYGYSVIHDTTMYDRVDRNQAYNDAAEGVGKLLEQYPSIEVVMDLHRDGVDESVHLVTEVNGKPTAKIMFVNGISKTTLQGEISYLHNPYIEDNLAFSLMLQLKAEAYYPEFTRRIMIKAYRYNMHFKPRTLLVEVGAQTNTLQEAKNAMEPLAVMLHKTLSGEE